MARYNNKRNKGTTYGKSFKKTSSKGSFRKGTLVKYKYVNGRRVSTVKAKR